MSLRACGHYVYVVDAKPVQASSLINTDHVRRGLLSATVSSAGSHVNSVAVNDRVIFAYCAGDDVAYGDTNGILLLDEKILCITHDERPSFGPV